MLEPRGKADHHESQVPWTTCSGLVLLAQGLQLPGQDWTRQGEMHMSAA